MSRTLAIGKQNFAEIRQHNCFYVDKTKFIKDWWNSQDDVTLITRPRLFGKTLMLDTVKTFFSTHCAKQSNLFEGLDVWRDEEFRSLQGTIPVISLSFADITCDNYAETALLIKECLNDIYDDFSRLLNPDLFSEREKRQFDSVQGAMADTTARTSLRYLAKHVVRQGYEKPIILLDAYDTPLREAWLHGFWDKLVVFMRGFFHSTFTSNPYLGRGLITGITQVAQESIFSDMNNLEVVSTTSDLYTDCFGFTEQEVFAAMDAYGLSAKEEVKRWYDGFIFGSTQKIYNPWSIVGYLKHRKFASYWAQTSSNRMVADAISQGGFDVQEEIGRLLQGKSIPVNMDAQIVFSEPYRAPGAIWSVLMAAGYVKPLTFDPVTEDYEIALTNHEVYFILKKLISNWFTVDTYANTGNFCKALLSDDCVRMNAVLNKIAKNTFSFFDTAKPEPERFYHAFVLGLIVDLKDRYEIRSNRESGAGRYDVRLFPKQVGDRGIVIECRTRKTDQEKDLQETCKNALKQIGEKGYTTELQAWKVPPNNIYVYGFAFEGKKVLICGGAYALIDWGTETFPGYLS